MRSSSAASAVVKYLEAEFKSFNPFNRWRYAQAASVVQMRKIFIEPGAVQLFVERFNAARADKEVEAVLRFAPILAALKRAFLWLHFFQSQLIATPLNGRPCMFLKNASI